MFALIADDLDPTGKPAKVVRELFASKPAFHAALDIRDVSAVTGIAVGWIAHADGTFGAYVAPAPTKADLKTYAATVRFRKEAAGITVNGAPVATDRQSQAMINGAYNYVTLNPTATLQFKATNGFVSLNAAAVTAMATAVAAHVQACFAKEATVDAAIDAGTVVAFADIDTAFASAL